MLGLLREMEHWETFIILIVIILNTGYTTWLEIFLTSAKLNRGIWLDHNLPPVLRAPSHSSHIWHFFQSILSWFGGQVEACGGVMCENVCVWYEESKDNKVLTVEESRIIFCSRWRWRGNGGIIIRNVTWRRESLLSPPLWYNTIPAARPHVSTTLLQEMIQNWFRASQSVSLSKKVIVAKHCVVCV